MTSGQPARRLSEEGFILIAVLWLLAALATLASVYSVYTIESAATARVPDDRVRAESAIRAGVELTAYRALILPKSQRPTHGAFETRIGDAKIDVRFRSEAARVDLNAAPKELLTGLFISLGASKSAADGYADRVIGWRQKAEPNADDSEAEAYRQAGLAYRPRAAPFDDVLELRLVTGLPPAIVERMSSLVTVYSGKAQVDVVDADAKTLAALPGVTPDALADVLQARAAGAAGKDLIARLGPASAGATIEPSDATRASILVQLRDGRRVQAEVVFRLNDGKRSPFETLYWRDDFDGPAPQGEGATPSRRLTSSEAMR